MKSTRPDRLVVGMLVALACSLAHAQSTSPDQTEFTLADMLDIDVVSVSKFTQKSSGAPASVSVISADDIFIHGYRTLAEALRSVRGFNITSDRLYSYAGVRGFAPLGDYNQRILLMIDGMRVNNNEYDQAMLGSEFSLDLNLVDRIEVVHGPGSSIYGNNAMFAVINVISKQASEIGNSLNVQLDSLLYRSAQATLAGELPHSGKFMLALSGEYAPGEDLTFPEFATSGGGNTSGTDYLRNQRLFGKLQLSGLEVMANFSHREKGNPGALSSGTFDDPRNRFVDDQAFLNVSFTRPLGADTDASVRLFLGAHDYNADYVYDYPPITVNSDFGQGRWWGSEVKLVSQLSDRQRLVYGLETQNNTRLRFYNYDVSPYALEFDENTHTHRSAIYLQDEWQITPNLAATMGGRYDRLSHQEDEFNPRLALVWQISKTSTFKSSYSTAFRTPTAAEDFWQNRQGPLGSVGLRPIKNEFIETLEVSIEHYPNADLRLAANAYSYRVRDQISYNPDYESPSDTPNPIDTNVFINLLKVRGRGVEGEIEKLLSDGSHLRASASLREVESSDHSRLLATPNWMAKLSYDRALGRAWFLGMESQIIGPMHTNLGSTDTSTVINVSFTRRMRGDGWQFSASIRDLFDSQPAQPVMDDGYGLTPRDTVPGEARSLRVSLTKKF